MKSALIEYHRERKHNFQLCLQMTKSDEMVEVEYYEKQIAFHDNAVVWLEHFDEGLDSAAAERQIQRENISKLIRRPARD